MSVPKPDRVKRSRFRSRETKLVSGGWSATEFTRQHTYPPYEHSGSPYVARKKTCRDWINKIVREDGSLEPSDLAIEDKVPAVCLVAGKNARHEVNGSYAGSIYNSTSLEGLEWAVRDQGDAAYVAQLLTQTSPFRSTISVPEMISDIAEVATLLRGSGASLVAKIASAQLTNSFVIQPFIDDIRTLSAAVNLIESRIKEFDSLFRKGGLRRRVHLHTYSLSPKTSDERVLYSSSFGFSRGTITETARCKVWGSCRWRAKEDLKYSQADFQDWKKQLAIFFDLENPFDLQTAWELVPFSWLIDYFTNLQEIFGSYVGREYVEPYDVCIMRNRTVTGSVNVSYNSGLAHLPNGNAISEGKYRTVVYETLPDLSSFALDFPSWGQAANILALLARIKSR